jgi:hypothetical protein
MRSIVVSVALVGVLLALPAGPAIGAAADGPRVAILGVGMAGAHTLRIDLATSGLDAPGADPPTVALAVWIDGVPARAALPLIHMPARFAMDLDLPAGLVRVGGVVIGAFHPVPRFTENLRFPVEVSVRRGALAATTRREATILLPTVIVPGYLNELGGPDEDAVQAFRRHGYLDRSPAPTLFWFTYPSRRVTLPEGARALAAYVRRVVLPATYAARINVVGVSAGGLLARWAIAYDVDGWETLVNRLVLVGVPNEGTVMAYLWGRAPGFLPFAGWAQTPLASALVPTFPFWRPQPAEAWQMPGDYRNALLAGLNARPLPPAIRVYVFYGSGDPRGSAGFATAAGMTGDYPAVTLSIASGDGVVTAASAQGLPVHGGPGVAPLLARTVLRVDLGAVYHLRLLDAGAERIAGALQDRFSSTVDEADSGQ